MQPQLDASCMTAGHEHLPITSSCMHAMYTLLKFMKMVYPNWRNDQPLLFWQSLPCPAPPKMKTHPSKALFKTAKLHALMLKLIVTSFAPHSSSTMILSTLTNGVFVKSLTIPRLICAWQGFSTPSTWAARATS